MRHDPEHTWGHTIAFGDQYHRRACELLQGTLDEAPTWTAVADRAVRTIRAGRTVHANVTTGHMPTTELANEREGNPAPFAFQGPDHHTAEQYAAMRAGDLLLTNCVTPAVREVRDRGVRVIVFTTAYVNSGSAPPGWLGDNPGGLLPADVADQVIDTRIPWEQGLVDVPQVPEMKVFPGSSNVSCAIHWCLTAEVMQALGAGGAPDGAKAREYLTILLERLDEVYRRHRQAIAAEAVALAKRVIGGGHVDVRGSNEGVRADAHGVAQGLMLTCAYEPRPAAAGGDDDTLIVTAVSADHPQEIAWAQEAKGNGARVVTVGMETSPRLRALSDRYLGNACDEAGGVVAVAGCEEPICPASGIIDNVLTQMLLAQMTDEMCRRGAVPYFYMGLYRAGGREYNTVLKRHFDARGY